MKKCYKTLFIILLITGIAPAQSFTFRADTLFQSAAPGTLFMVDGWIINTAPDTLQLDVVRVRNEVPSRWLSSMCLWPRCFAPPVDSVSTFMAPGDTLRFILDVSSNPDLAGQAIVEIVVKRHDIPTESVSQLFTFSTNPTAIVTDGGQISGTFRLNQNFPNPFNPSTQISFEIAGPGLQPTRLTVFNALGQVVRVLLQKKLSPGVYQATWDGRNRRGAEVSSGMYFYELVSGNQRKVGRMILLR